MNVLEKFRTTVGLTQSDIATITGLTRQSVSAIECGLWEKFPEDVHLQLKQIAQDEFGFPWPINYLATEANYQSERVNRRVLTRQTTPISRVLSGRGGRGSVSNQSYLDAALKTGHHVFAVWRHRAVGVTSVRQFAKLIALNPEIVRAYELSRPFGQMPASLEEALLDCGVDVDRLKRLVNEYWTVTR